MDTISVEICNKDINSEWDSFLAKIPAVCYEQSSVWAKTSQLGGWDTHRILIRDKGVIVCGAQIFLLKIPVFGRIGNIVQGPCVNGAAESHIDILVKEIKKYIRRNKVIYLNIDVAYNLPDLPIKLIHHGFEPRMTKLPPQPLIESTLVINLSQELDTIMANFKSGRRKSIRSGLKQPIDIRVGTRDDIELFYNLMLQTCERRKTKPLYPFLNFYYELWDNFTPNGWMVMHIAETEGKPICASLSFTMGDTFRNCLWGWSGEFNHLNVSDVIDWKTICWAKENGFKYYDFVQLDVPSARAFLAGGDISDEIKAREHYGATFYKMRFGGEVIFYPGTYTFFPNKVVRYFSYLFCKWILGNKYAIKIIQKLRLLMIKKH
jgi:lipid II:glycine glycyltransferase (peptidoglycan interpeptide bridge formation enzyme)